MCLASTVTAAGLKKVEDLRLAPYDLLPVKKTAEITKLLFAVLCSPAKNNSSKKGPSSEKDLF